MINLLPHCKIKTANKMWTYWLLTLLLHFSTEEAAATDFVKDGCEPKCGNISIPYPFGIGDRHCALNDNFWLNCSSSSDELLLFPNMWVTNVSVDNGTITTSIEAAFDCYDASGQPTRNFTQEIGLGSGPFTFSATQNKFVAIGCDTIALVANNEATYGVGCISSCDVAPNLTETSSCTGFGCCKTSIGTNLKSLTIQISSLNNHANISQFNPCGYGFLVGENSFKVEEWDMSSLNNPAKKSDVVIEWVVETTDSCEAAKANRSSYSCGNNTDCEYSGNGQGYRCSCSEGFQGNPYLPFGCQDINECDDPKTYRCSGKCKNTIGNYTCECPLGMRGDGKTGCQGFRITTIVAVVGASIFLVIMALLLYIIWIRREKEKIFRRNGGLILKHQRVRLFTESELIKATKNYDKDWRLGEGGFGSVHKGVLEDNTSIAVKKPKEQEKAQINQEFEHEMTTVSQVNHKNVVKILGLCLETKVPLLVYELISNGTLFQHIHSKRSQILNSWRNRLRIAAETASALGYLHSLADPPIIHGDVKTLNILLDDNYTAKVSDFGASVLVSPDQRDMIATKIQGTLGYLDPEYLMTGILTEKSDVYSFGVVLVELLTGQNPNGRMMGNTEKKNIIQHFISSLENNELDRIIDFRVSQGEMEEIKEMSEVAISCLNPSGMKRPTMNEVAEELAKLWKWHESVWSHHENEETDKLLGVETRGITMKPDTINAASFSIEYSMDSV